MVYASSIGFLRKVEDSWFLERFLFAVESVKFGEDYDRESKHSEITYAVAEWSRAPVHPPREGGGAGSDPSFE